MADIEKTYVGNRALYFLGVMNNVHHEYLKRPIIPAPPALEDDAGLKERTHHCLERCLGKLAPHSRKLIERYYAADKQAKIDLRKAIAAEFGIGVKNLRLRALRIREKLQVCIEQCLEVETF